MVDMTSWRRKKDGCVTCVDLADRKFYVLGRELHRVDAGGSARTSGHLVSGMHFALFRRARHSNVLLDMDPLRHQLMDSSTQCYGKGTY